MASIKTTLSSLEGHRNNTRNEYSSILFTARDLLSQVKQKLEFATNERDNVDSQRSRAEALEEEAGEKASRYESAANEAYNEYYHYDEKMTYIMNNPKTVSDTDSDGNTVYRKVVDWDAYYAAKNRSDAAYSEYRHYSEKKDCSERLQASAGEWKEYCDSLYNAINDVCKEIERVAYDIQNNINLISDDSEYNLRALENLIQSVQNYIYSKAIFYPKK